ncbi:hypothetical protein EN784_42910 [bacterium M00.F.Ca.ET.141.01.1.1]|uniref:hypothetical protein n=1 Tax=unclassified Mesorhizobium TaxID=325217 RepID=UPI000FCA9B84|nr:MULTISPECIES: hypothetical protein [unclassified Mesorhizobium]RUX04916.1 hypothetical protein EOA30_13315 [Mesorhizobium sp. M8A.F.Ca.ET.059.01.1.1]TGV53009.1 hypothetical protein EN784_42910 [bacterium M00.F.Ca.ET.141.01.1.1]RUW56382.1 hypothetical protein EOA36_04545 [Mesorhizobium sp. M8A.F.Ca.ET.021.01.1.1]TGQ01592.1 hypothetical protein EN861_02450 [Mesorhizobium sp. M8A.F.Ca.ET.218.01.1.1]TGS43942.1 hypothetical protein EN825_18135 [Mesorhizobium sp. M8A.F.Ca.ET.182.01.1.1]
MDAIEKAIRNALEKGNAEDRAFRERVYRSAFAALDRALQANPGVTVEVAIKRRKAIQAKITEIESEYLPAVPGVAPQIDAIDAPAGEAEVGAAPAVEAGPRVPSPAVSVDAPVQPASDAPRSRVLPVVPDIMPDATLPGAPTIDMWAPAAPGAPTEVAPDRDERRIRGRRLPLTAIFFTVTLLAAVGIGLFFAMQTGVFKSAAELNTAPPEAPPTVEDDDFTPADGANAPAKPGAADQSHDWINVFSPTDPSHVAAPSDAKAEVMKDDSGPFLRIRSGASGSAIAFDVGQGVLEKLAGKHAVFDIIARAEDGKDTQISVDCNFGELGDCGRKRYAVGQQKNEYLFDVKFPDKHPGSAGTIAVNSDFDKQGKAVNVYEIRVSIEP